MTEADRDPEISYAPIEAAEVRQMPRESGLSQAAFNDALGTHKRSVQRWEAGTMRASGPALVLLTLVKRRGMQALL